MASLKKAVVVFLCVSVLVTLVLVNKELDQIWGNSIKPSFYTTRQNREYNQKYNQKYNHGYTQKYNQNYNQNNEDPQKRKSTSQDSRHTHENHKVKVMIVTYARSGSTFTGDLFNQHKDVFYVYEPLHKLAMMKHSKEASTVTYRNKQRQIKNLTRSEFEMLQTDVLRGYLNCGLHDIPRDCFNDWIHKMSNSTDTFLKCHRKSPGRLGFLGCLADLEAKCHRSQVVVLKTIRYSMLRARQLLQEDSHLRVIHLVRDPRGTLDSWERFGKFNKPNLVKNARSFCNDVIGDLVVGNELMETFPGRVVRVRYEDIALRPVHYAHKLLGLAGLSLTTQHEAAIRKVTEAELLKESRGIRVKTTNSSSAAFRWRDEYDLDSVRGVNSVCAEALKLEGYLPLHNESEVRDRWNVPSMLPVYKVPGFLL